MKKYDETITISKNKALTSEGFLICQNASLARIGARDYAAVEVPGLKADSEGIVKIFRDSAALFDEATIASVRGKPITLGHPADEVTPENSDVIVGTILNVYEGKDELLADLIIYDKEAIEAINNGISELSLGFDSDVEQTTAGLGRESNIRCNHVALVSKGRCGAQCSIKDSDGKENSKSFIRGILKMFNKKNDADGTELEQLVKTLAEQLNALSEKVANLEKNLKPDETEAEEKADKKDAMPDINQLIKDAVASALADVKQQDKANGEIKRDAAIVAPNVDLNIDDLALTAISEYFKSDEGKKAIEQLGGLEACKKDAAASLKALALSKRLANSTVKFNDEQPKKNNYFDAVKNLWN